MASSSSSVPDWKYDVFLNFRGQDTRKTFISHLHKALARNSINTFIDAEGLRKGEGLSQLLTAIIDSRLSIVVFSQNYASSTWCLKELVQILQCMDQKKQIVIPIFYQVDPSHVRKIKGSFEEAFSKHKHDPKADREEVQRWRSALQRAPDLCGWDSQNCQDDAKLIESIVDDISKKLFDILPSEKNGLVGMDSRLQKMDSLLCPEEEKAEAHLYTIIKVARNEDLFEQIGKNIYFDLVDHDKVHSFRIQKQMPFNLFKEEVAKEFGIPVQFQRFWKWAKRRNHTYRPNQPLTPLEEAQSVGQLREVSNKSNNAELKLFLEVELGPDLLPLSPPEKTKEYILLFFKFYDPLKEELRYVGRLFVKRNGKPVELLTKLHEMAGLSPDEKIELFEEIQFEPNIMCEHIDEKDTFCASLLEDGDIICFQKSPQGGSSQQFRYPDVPSFLDYVRNRQNRHTFEKPVKIYN